MSDEAQPDRAKGVAAFREGRLTRAQVQEAWEQIRQRLGLDVDADPDPLIDLPKIATLAGVQPGTPSQWRQRTARGQMREPFPDADDTRYADKPQWRAVSTVVPWLQRTRRWHLGEEARSA